MRIALLLSVLLPLVSRAAGPGGAVVVHPAMGPVGGALRNVTVWLPEGYDPKSRERYGVLYLHDGQNVLDPARSSFGTEWSADETVARLMAADSLPPMLIVAVDNTADRRAEYGLGPAGDAYRAWFAGPLKNFIDANYATHGGPRTTWVGGASMGGLVSFLLGWQYPEVYGAAICMSPAFRYLDFDYPSQLTGPAPKSTFFWIDNGTEDLDAQLMPGVEAMAARLPELGCAAGDCFSLFIDQGAHHFEADWARRLPAALLRSQEFSASGRFERGRCTQ